MTNYLVTIPLHKETSHEMGESLIMYVFYKYGCLGYLICDEDQEFLSSILQYVY